MTKTRRYAVPVVVVVLALMSVAVAVNLARIRPSSSGALLPLTMALPGVAESARPRGTQ